MFSERKKELLLQRGFSKEDIDNELSEYCEKKKGWNISAVSPEDVRDSESIDVLKMLFCKDCIQSPSFGAPYAEYNLRYFAVHESAYTGSMAELDPYIACFVRAVNACGVNTGMSCDGWHRHYDKDQYRPMKLWMLDRYSTLWLWLIMEHVFGEKWDPGDHRRSLMWHDQWEPHQYDGNETYTELEVMREYHNEKSLLIYRITKGREKETYEKLYRQAQFLEKYKSEIQYIKRNMLYDLLMDKAVEDICCNMDFLGIRRIMEKYCRKDLAERGKLWQKQMRAS